MLIAKCKNIIDTAWMRATRWCTAHDGDPYLLYVLATLVGVAAGMAAAVLKGAITMVMHLTFSLLNIQEGNWAFLLLPIGGIMIAVLITRYIVHKPMDSATERIADDLRQNQPYLSPRLILGSIVTCSFTLGMGGSAGAESPIAYTGAAIGSNLARALKLQPVHVLNLLGCGAAAGIAGIYMAPIGGVMYALEVLRMRQSLETILAVTFSSLAAALTSYLMLGCHTDVSFVPAMRFDTHLIPYVLVLGALCGIYSVYYSAVINRFGGRLERVANIWLRALWGGGLLAAMLYVFPSLYGEGYGIISKLMDNDPMSIISYSPLYPLGKHFWVLMLLFVALLAVKPFATAATNESGGVGGDFTPTFFCGGVAGFFFAAMMHHYLHIELPYALFAFFGMAAVMSGAKQAPLMAIFIAAEMTGMYGFILPLTLTAISSVVTMLVFKALISSLPSAPAAPSPQQQSKPDSSTESGSSTGLEPPTK